MCKPAGKILRKNLQTYSIKICVSTKLKWFNCFYVFTFLYVYLFPNMNKYNIYWLIILFQSGFNITTSLMHLIIAKLANDGLTTNMFSVNCTRKFLSFPTFLAFSLVVTIFILLTFNQGPLDSSAPFHACSFLF